MGVGTYPVSAVVTPDGRYLYVANMLSSNISVINTATSSVEETIPLDGNIHGTVLTADGGHLYVLCAINDNNYKVRLLQNLF
jgi:YVTN family beta-propeller protein